MTLQTASRARPGTSRRPGRSRPPAPLGDVLATWLLCAFLVVAGLITYARFDPVFMHADTTRSGLAAGLSRVVMATNMPVALIAIGVVLVVLDSLPAVARWLGAAAIVMCASMAWPGVVDDSRMDARAVNLIPAAGVALAAGLTVVAGRRAGWSRNARRRLDPARLVVGAFVVVLSLPWIAAETGFYLPSGVFLTAHRVAESNGELWPAVHHGYHHGFGGALLMLSALLLSRPYIRSRGKALARRCYVGLMFGYGAVNFANDLWGEQIVKRGWSHWTVPSAVHPRMHPVWLVILAIAVVVALLIRYEDGRDASHSP